MKKQKLISYKIIVAGIIYDMNIKVSLINTTTKSFNPRNTHCPQIKPIKIIINAMKRPFNC